MKIGSSICLFSDGVILVDCGEGTRWRKDEKLRIDSTLILLLLLDPAINEKTINEMRCYILYTGTVLSQTHKSQVSLLNKRTPATTRRTPHLRHSAWSRRRRRSCRRRGSCTALAPAPGSAASTGSDKRHMSRPAVSGFSLPSREALDVHRVPARPARQDRMCGGGGAAAL
jgi:hypothetical protein